MFHPPCPSRRAPRAQPVRQPKGATLGLPLGLWPALVSRHPETLARLAAYATQLHALPRRVRRALRRQWRGPLVGLALVLALGQRPGLAATIPVSDTCTLVDALTAANTDTATGGCPAGSGADTVVLPPGSTQTLTEVNVVSSVVTIAGQGSTITRDQGAPEFRLFAVSSPGHLMLQETTVSGGGGGGIVNNYGTVTITNSTLSGNSSGFGGGGVANYYGTVTITNSTLSGNVANNVGGGVANHYGTVTITNSTLSGNVACDHGGGVVNYRGTVTVINSTLSGNYACFGGGGVANRGYEGRFGTVTITNSTLSGNSASNVGGGVENGGGTVTVTTSTLSGNSTRFSGGGVDNNDGGTVTITNSTLSGNTAAYGNGGGVANRGGTVTVTTSTLSGNSASYGGGIANFYGTVTGTVTITTSTLSGNVASNGGGVGNYSGTVTVINSTLSGNSASFGGGVGNGGHGGRHGGRFATVTVINSTLSGNSVDFLGGGVANYGATVTLTRTLVSGNTAPQGPEISHVVDPVYGSGTVLADNHNLFGVNGTAGVEGFSPGATDIVPPAGVPLPDILDPTLAFNGGLTQTHALVPGSLAIDAGGPVCTDATGAPLLTDQRGRPRVVDGNGDGTAACDIGAFEFFPLVNAFVTLDPALDTTFEPTPVPGGPAGSFTITATFTNTSATPLRFPFFTVTELTGGNLVLNADAGVQGVGATVTPAVEDQVLAPGETVAVDFVIGLQAQEPFRFFVDLFGEPLP